MRFRLRAPLLAIVTIAAAAACSGSRPALLAPDYEYEEDLTLSLDGSATLVVNTSTAALAALHGIHLEGDLRSRADQLKSEVRSAYGSAYADVTSVTVWTRHGRRFIGVRLRVPDITALSKAPPFAWSTYELRPELRPDGELMIFRQTISGKGTPDPGAQWTGDELVAFRLHLPARIRFHNSRDLRTGGVRGIGRGNILTWEQTLRDRLAGKPIAWSEDHRPGVMEAHMDRESILYRTLWLFGIAFAAAIIVLAGLIWLTMRRGDATDAAEGTASRH
ncbi:MAG TPA: hypothetical protein VFZ98_07520 [Vicinamibacterales bacterium]